MRLARVTSVLALAEACFANALAHQGKKFLARGLERSLPLLKREDTATVGYFDQLLDHSDPSAGTFEQRYWWNTDYYAGPGSPIVLMAPSLGPADDSAYFMSNRSLFGTYAQAIGGAIISIEHRYFGKSSPIDELTGEKMKFLTVDNIVQDLVNFAQKAELPFDTTRSSSPQRAPWVLVGNGWSGTLVAWTSKLFPDTFWAYHASAASVQTFRENWHWFEPIEKTMPRNCSADYKRVVAYVDEKLAHGSPEERQKLKDDFGLGKLKHDDDFASAIPAGLASWPDQYVDEEYPRLFEMCDYIEV
ncbi:hypothetical protein CDD83_508 [Cordyceps sp. RAO-2017]|nr:hypothetical protein CDD83_508 [Cordyceps sp. RAO-2017]